MEDSEVDFIDYILEIKELWVAVIVQSIADISNKDEEIRAESLEFLESDFCGGILSCMGVDVAVLEKVKKSDRIFSRHRNIKKKKTYTREKFYLVPTTHGNRQLSFIA
jgi:hypothetical protein